MGSLCLHTNSTQQNNLGQKPLLMVICTAAVTFCDDKSPYRCLTEKIRGQH